MDSEYVLFRILLCSVLYPFIVCQLFSPPPPSPTPPPPPLPSIAMVCWAIHYIKRILETLFVHRFSHNTMPIMNLFKVRLLEDCYFWVLGL